MPAIAAPKAAVAPALDVLLTGWPLMNGSNTVTVATWLVTLLLLLS